MSADAIREELEEARSAFHEMLASVSQRGWHERSENPGWTNGQLLFHIMLGLAVVVPLVSVLRVFVALPETWSKRFAALLNFSTPLFNAINGFGPRIGARLYTWRNIGSKYDRVHAAVLKKMESIRADEWSRGMHYPRKWDPRFREFMTLEDLFRYPAIHLKHHQRQLRVTPT